MMKCALDPPDSETVEVARLIDWSDLRDIKATTTAWSDVSSNAAAAETLFTKLEQAHGTLRRNLQRGTKRKRSQELSQRASEADEEEEDQILADVPPLQVDTSEWRDRRWKPILEAIHNSDVYSKRDAAAGASFEDLTARELASLEDDDDRLIAHIVAWLSEMLQCVPVMAFRAELSSWH
jgi:hypothetical protein